jgi:hypothetical protein
MVTRVGVRMAQPTFEGDRLDAWYDGSAICVIAVSSFGDPMDLGDEEVEEFIEKLRRCLRESKGSPHESV